MKNIFLHGELASKFGEHIKLDVSSCAEAIRAIFVNYPDLKKYIDKKQSEGVYYAAGYSQDDPIETEGELNFSTKKDIHIFPAPAGSMASLAMMGVTSFIGAAINSKIAKSFEEKDDGSPLKVQSKSYLIEGQSNRSFQGGNIPLGYGRMKLGSSVISSATLNYDWDKEKGSIINPGGLFSLYPQYKWGEEGSEEYIQWEKNPIFISQEDQGITALTVTDNRSEESSENGFGSFDSIYGAMLKKDQAEGQIVKNIRKQGNALGGYLYYEYNYFKGFDKETLARMGSYPAPGGQWSPDSKFSDEIGYGEAPHVSEKDVNLSSCVCLQSLPRKEGEGGIDEKKFYPVLFNDGASSADQRFVRLVGKRYKSGNKESGVGWDLLESISIYKSIDLLCEGPVEGFCDQYGGSHLPIKEKGSNGADASFTENRKFLQGVYLDDVPVMEIPRGGGSQGIFNINEFDIDVATDSKGGIGTDEQELMQNQYLFTSNTKQLGAKLYGGRKMNPNDFSSGATYGFQQKTIKNKHFIGGTIFQEGTEEVDQPSDQYQVIPNFSTVKWETFDSNGELSRGGYYTSRFNITADLGVGTGFYRAPEYYYDPNSQVEGQDLNLINFESTEIYDQDLCDDQHPNEFDGLSLYYDQVNHKFYTPYNGSWDPDRQASINDYKVFSGQHVDIENERYYNLGDKVRVKGEDGYHYVTMGQHADKFLGIFNPNIDISYYENKVGYLVFGEGGQDSGVPVQDGRLFLIIKSELSDHEKTRETYGSKLPLIATELSFPRLKKHSKPTDKLGLHPIGYKQKMSWTKSETTLNNEKGQLSGTVAKLDSKDEYYIWNGSSWSIYFGPDTKNLNSSSDVVYKTRNARECLARLLINSSDIENEIGASVGSEIDKQTLTINSLDNRGAFKYLSEIFGRSNDDITPSGNLSLWEEVYINSPEEVWVPHSEDEYSRTRQADGEFIQNLYLGNESLTEVADTNRNIQSFEESSEKFKEFIDKEIAGGNYPRVIMQGGVAEIETDRNKKFRFQNLINGMEEYFFELSGQINDPGSGGNSENAIYTNLTDTSNYSAGQHEPSPGSMIKILDFINSDENILQGFTIEFTTGNLSGESREIYSWSANDVNGVPVGLIIPYKNFSDIPTVGSEFKIYRNWKDTGEVTSIRDSKIREDILNITNTRNTDANGDLLPNNGLEVLLQPNTRVIESFGHPQQLNMIGVWIDWRQLGTDFKLTIINSSIEDAQKSASNYLNISNFLFKRLLSTNRNAIIADQEEYPVRHNIINPLVDELYVTLQINQLFYIYPGDEVKITYKIGQLMLLIGSILLAQQIGAALQSSGITIGGGTVGTTKNFGSVAMAAVLVAIGAGVLYYIGDKNSTFSMGTRIDNSGELWPNKVMFRIKYGNIGEELYSTDVAFYSIVNNPYRKDIKIFLPDNPGNKQRVIKIYKLTRERNPVVEGEQAKRYAADVEVASITEVVKTRTSYPNSVVVGTRVNARDTGGKVPTRNYDLKLKKVLVPTGYDPEIRRYPDLWDGTFKPEKQWTDNPAWCLMDIISNKSYGLGKFGIQLENVDKWTLYKMAKYCDQFVPTGYSPKYNKSFFNVKKNQESILLINKLNLTNVEIFEMFGYSGAGLAIFYEDSTYERAIIERISYDAPGNPGYFAVYITEPLQGSLKSGYCATEIDYPLVEPRYTMNALIMESQSAYKMINEMLAVFRSFMYWSEGKIQFFQDEHKDSVMFFNNASISEEGFSYSNLPKTARTNKVKIRYTDKYESFKPKIEVSEDKEAINQNNIIESSVEGFGITSQSQAKRAAEFLIKSANLETEVVSFKTNIVGSYLRPGDIIDVLDNKRTIGRFAGKIKNTIIDQQARYMHIYLDYPINSIIESWDKSTWKSIEIFDLSEFETIQSLDNNKEQVDPDTGENNIDNLRKKQTRELQVVEISKNRERLTIIDESFQYIEGEFTFEEAVHDAKERGGQLASIGSDQDQYLLYLNMPKGKGNAWIGGMYKNGRFEWLNPKNYTAEITYDGWIPRKQDEEFGDLPFSADPAENYENYGYYLSAAPSDDPNAHGKWMSVRGDLKQGYILEKKVNLDDQSIFNYKDAKNKSFIIKDTVNMANPRQYMVESIKEENKGAYSIQAKEYNFDKFDSIEKDLQMRDPITPVIYNNQYIENHRTGAMVDLEVIEEVGGLVSFVLHGKWRTEMEPSHFQLEYIQDGQTIATFEVTRGDKDSEGYYNHSFRSAKIKEKGVHSIRVLMSY
jgi:predicted phage tail protein